MLESHDPMHRICGFDVLEVIGPEAAEPYVRHLLDSPAAEGAANFLVRHGFATEDEMEPFIGYGLLIDLFAGIAGTPARFSTWFTRLLERAEAPELLLRVIALYPSETATMVLTAAARHIDDPRFAEMIRKAEIDHHDWLAERDPAL